MRVEDTAWFTTRSTSIAEPHRPVFVPNIPRFCFFCGGDKCLISIFLSWRKAFDRGHWGKNACLRSVVIDVVNAYVFVGKKDTGQASDFFLQFFKLRGKPAINKDQVILCLSHNLGELGGSEANVERMKHRADARNRIIELQVLIRIQGIGRHPIPWPYTALDEDVCHPLNAAIKLGVSVTVQNAGTVCRHPFIAVDAACMFQNPRDIQWIVHHQSVHFVLSARPPGLNYPLYPHYKKRTSSGSTPIERNTCPHSAGDRCLTSSSRIISTRFHRL